MNILLKSKILRRQETRRVNAVVCSVLPQPANKPIPCPTGHFQSCCMKLLCLQTIFLEESICSPTPICHQSGMAPRSITSLEHPGRTTAGNGKLIPRWFSHEPRAAGRKVIGQCVGPRQKPQQGSPQGTWGMRRSCSLPRWACKPLCVDQQQRLQKPESKIREPSPSSLGLHLSDGKMRGQNVAGTQSEAPPVPVHGPAFSLYLWTLPKMLYLKWALQGRENWNTMNIF